MGKELKEKMKYKISLHENEKISNTVATEANAIQAYEGGVMMLARWNPYRKKTSLLAEFEMLTMPNEQNKTIYEIFEKAQKSKSKP